jgi:two-component system, OmpR family, alkaline phosphatase synthesis response regulator PhoP
MARILVTDGDLAARSMIEVALRRRGFRVIATPGGPALEAVEAFAFDAMIVDLPPATSGNIDAIRILRRNAPEVPIIVVTRSGAPPRTAADFPGHGAHLGVACCLNEPFTPGDLVAAVEACLARRRARPDLHRR